MNSTSAILRPADRAGPLRWGLVMPLLSKIVDRFGGERQLVMRYLGTSLVNVVNHQVLLQVALRWWDWGGGSANAFAGVVAALPAYLLSRYWVWQVVGRPNLRTEVIPFWTISLLGLVASTATAVAADALFDRPIMISVGSLVGYFIVWVLKFVILDRLFNRVSDAATIPVV